MHFSNARGIHANGLYMRKALMLICILQWNLPGQSQPQLGTVAENGPGLSFVEWSNACTRLPSNRALGERMPPKSLLPLSGFGELDSALNDFFQQCKHGS